MIRPRVNAHHVPDWPGPAKWLVTACIWGMDPLPDIVSQCWCVVDDFGDLVKVSGWMI